MYGHLSKQNDTEKINTDFTITLCVCVATVKNTVPSRVIDPDVF